MKAKDLRAAIQSEETDSVNKLSQTIEKNNSTCNTKQMKEAVFQHLVGKNMAEEEKNQLRWLVVLSCTISIYNTSSKALLYCCYFTDSYIIIEEN